jgi:acyl carrier protein
MNQTLSNGHVVLPGGTPSRPALDARSQEAVQAWLARWLAAQLALDAAALAPTRTFLSYGLNSVQAMMLVGDLEDALRLRLPPTLIWDHRSVEDLARHVVERAGAATAENGCGAHVQEPAVARSPAGSHDAQALLQRLDQLSEAEVDALLQDYLKPSR